MGDSGCWGYADEPNPERWIGSGTREEAIADGHETYPGKPFWIACGRRPEASEYLPDADDILEIAAERAYEDAGDLAEDFPYASEEAKKELDALIEQWAKTHVTVPTFWVDAGPAERIEPIQAGEHEKGGG